jgi:cholesterol transport system auxiliary component
VVPLIRRPLLLLACVLLAACASPEPASRDRFFALEPQTVVTAGPSVAGVTLLVNDLAARGFLGGRQIVFRAAEEPLEVQRYHQLLWEDPPGRALAQALVAAVRESGLFEHVVTPAQRARTDYLLGGELTRFEHLPTDRPPRVRAELTLTLLRRDDRRSLVAKRYSGEELTGGDSPEAMIRAFDQLSARLLGEVVRDLQSLGPRLRLTRGR